MSNLKQVETLFLSTISGDKNVFFEILKTGINDISGGKEPVLNFNSSEIKELIKCCALVFGGIGEILYYPTHKDRITQLFYSIIKGHKLRNGNKRAGCLIILIYYRILFIAGITKYPMPDKETLKSLAKATAESSDESAAKAQIKERLFS